MPMTAQEALRSLKREGWIIVRQTDSHVQLVKDGQRITVPNHPAPHRHHENRRYVQ